MSKLSAVLLVASIITVFLYAPSVYAHPGNTDGNGCHTCRTNCTERWGIPYGFYHRHYPVRSCFVPISKPTATFKPLPTATPTLKVISTSTPIPTLTPTSTPLTMQVATPTAEPKVLGESKSTNGVSGDTVLGIMTGMIGFVIVFWRAINQKWPFHSRTQ